MKKTIALSALLVLGGLGFATTASAQDLTCDDLVWSPTILANNPNIGDACLDVREKDGQTVAVFNARVVRQSVNSTIVQWKLPDGSWSESQRRYPERGFLAHVGDQPVRVLDLAARQEVNVYVPAGEAWSMPVAEAAPAAAPVAAAPVAAAVVAEPEPEPAPAALPTTATQLPMLALLGGLLVLLGGAIGIVRTRL